ncbi:hypothetical protein EYF80_029456 [Liparis tanakae]|uniref:Uncharacterized protein n=1 Tax=Liparis tanakae TaxID=230148 RepID=A0A4Z2H3W6_9TELE|nr:hypothetical protein EYF80_029456 [Liparis tanakae]
MPFSTRQTSRPPDSLTLGTGDILLSLPVYCRPVPLQLLGSPPLSPPSPSPLFPQSPPPLSSPPSPKLQTLLLKRQVSSCSWTGREASPRAYCDGADGESRYDVLVLLAVDGAGGVDQALQARELEAVVQAAQLEGGQRGQTSLDLVLVRRGRVVPETHHTWTPRTQITF